MEIHTWHATSDAWKRIGSIWVKMARRPMWQTRSRDESDGARKCEGGRAHCRDASMRQATQGEGVMYM